MPSTGATGAIEAMSLWAGESVGGVKRGQPAAEIIQELAGEAARLKLEDGAVLDFGPGVPAAPGG